MIKDDYWNGKKVLVTGSSGFLGTHLVLKLKTKNIKQLYLPQSQLHNLLDQKICRKVVKGMDIVIHLAARVGGIGLNRKIPAEMYYDNIMMGTQLLHEAYLARVSKFVALGTICCYPKHTPVPFKEDNLWNGYPEETNAPYGLAKKMLLVQSQAYRQQYNFNSIFLLPVNLYGPGDNFNNESSHVIPALIKKIYEAKEKNKMEVEVWGTGKATREFLYVEDAVDAIILATERYDKAEPVNIGAGFEISIKDLAEKLSEMIGYKGKLKWNKTKPDGQPRRMLDVKRARNEFGFKASVEFEKGLMNTIKWYSEIYERGKTRVK